MTGATLLARMGFDADRLRTALRTAVAACLALLVAWLIGLDHPQWAAMTVWATAQPVRGQLLEKGLFRVAGTASGSVAGVLLIVLSDGQPLPLVLGLSVWIALCAGIGNVQRGFVAYGTVLAGYSASMVALLDAGHPDHVLVLGADRMATVLVGVVAALLVGLFFAPRASEEALMMQLRRLTARVLAVLADGLAGKVQETGARHALLAEMAAIEDMLEPHGAGSLRSRRRVRATRTLLMAEISVLLLARDLAGQGGSRPDIAAALRTVVRFLEEGRPRPEILEAFEHLGSLCVSDPILREPMATLMVAIRACWEPESNLPATGPSRHPVILHRDWAAGWRSAVRAGSAMLAVGLFWVATGWSAGPFLLLGVSVMTSLFSTFDNPVRTMRFVFLGQCFGVMGALACRFLAWPLAQNEVQVVLLTMPFILASALFFSHRRSLPTAFDFAMVSLLLLQPAYPMRGDFPHMLAGGLAVVAAPLIAMLAYRFLFPIDTGHRLDLMQRMMVRELRSMAAAANIRSHRRVWRARLYHRLLRVAVLAERGGRDRAQAIEGALAVLSLGSAVLAMRDALSAGGLPHGVRRALTLALARLSRPDPRPDRTALALVRAAERLAPVADGPARVMIAAAGALRGQADFFARAA